MAIGIMVRISCAMILMLGIKTMMKIERAVRCRKMMMMGDNSVQHQQHIGWE